MKDLIDLGFTENVDEELLWFDEGGNLVEVIKTPWYNTAMDEPEEDNKI